MERLSMLYPSRYMMANVPMMDMGSAKLGMMVAEIFLRNRKITSTTRPTVSNSVNLTSSMDSRMDSERSYSVAKLTDVGICARNVGSSFFTPSTTATVLV